MSKKGHLYIKRILILKQPTFFFGKEHNKKKKLRIQTLWNSQKNDWWLGSQATEGLQHGWKQATPGKPGTGGVGVGLSIQDVQELKDANIHISI